MREPKHLATPPPGWRTEPAAPAKVAYCDCIFTLDDLEGKGGSELFSWPEVGTEPVCLRCNRLAHPTRIVFESVPVPDNGEITEGQLARLKALANLKLEATRRRVTEAIAAASEPTGRRLPGAPRFRSTSVVVMRSPKLASWRVEEATGRPSARYMRFLNERSEQRELAAQIEAAESEDAAVTAIETAIPNDAEAQEAAEAHGDDLDQQVAV